MVALTIYPFRTQNYAYAVYIYGTNRLTARDGYVGLANGYYEPVERYAATNFTKTQIDNALTQGWISEQEYNETISYIPV